MKCSELQIGDYVFVKPSMMLIKIDAVHHKKVGYHAVTHKLNWVRMDLLEPSMLEHAYLNGYKRCLKELQETDEGEILPNPLEGITTEKIGEFLKDNIIPALHHDIDRAVFNEDYEELLKYMRVVEYTLTNFKKKLEIAILEK